MKQLFYLDDLEIEEPVGFADIELSVKRDEVYHGMSYEASTSSLQFYGYAADYLKNKKETEGVKANVLFTALTLCEGYDYEELLSGRLNFGKYKESCGSQCMVTLPVEQDSCAIIFNSRKDQKVDIDKNTGVDNIMPLADYAGLGVSTELPAHETSEGVEGYVSETQVIDTGMPVLTFPARIAIRPDYERQINNTINQGNLVSTNNILRDPIDIDDPPLTPQLLFDDTINCFNGDFGYTTIFKGSLTFEAPDIFNIFSVKSKVVTWDGVGDFFDNSVVISETTLLSGQAVAASTPFTLPFDVTISGTTTIANGLGLYGYIEIILTKVFDDTAVDVDGYFDIETYIGITAVKSCPATNAELYFVHETLSRATEAITNGCIRVKSSFYGRTDSEPFAFPADGCGGLRTLTSGLKIRQAVEDKFFASLKDLIEGLSAIDNIGFDIIDDPDIPDRSLLRIESLDFFYQDIEILRHDGAPNADTEVEEKKHYSLIEVGYKKWEVEIVNGLDEFNSNRQYNTSIDTINSNLDITSILVAGTYPIEITRQQSFADSGGADTKYDNDIFIICMERPSYPYGSIQVELGNITNAQNIFSPATIYNYRISPLRNLMRWYRTIAAGFVALSDSTNKLFFLSGTGNLIASGLMTDTTCRQENTDLAENQNIFVTKFTNVVDYTPIWKNELITYEYPMSVADYRAIKGNPYGYISVQCGVGDFLKYWIREIKYKPMKGTATITARRKYGS